MSRRKSMVSREPNGRAKRTPPLPSPTEVSRLRDAALAGLRDPVWSSTLGYLYLAGKVTGSQFAAGKRWHDLAADYDRATAAPRAPRSAKLEPGGGEAADPDSARGVREARREVHVVQQYLAAHELLKRTGEPARHAVEAICELNQMPIGAAQSASLSTGLTVLAAFWGRK